MSFSNPLVSVLLPVYNAELYIAEAIQSILNQTYPNFELLIINDGSTDGSIAIIESFNDSRIRLVHNPHNLKLIATLNLGLRLAQGKYVARMDADDISAPERLAIQVEFLEKNPQIGVCGSWIEKFSESKRWVPPLPTEPADLKTSFLLGTPFAHPTVMFRKACLESSGLSYDSQYPNAEDYRLWTQLAEITQIANIPQVLLYYREHDSQISQTAQESQNQSAAWVRKELVQKVLGKALSEEQLQLHELLARSKVLPCPYLAKEVGAWFSLLRKANHVTQYYDEHSLQKLLSEKLLQVCQVSESEGLAVFRTYQKFVPFKSWDRRFFRLLRHTWKAQFKR